MYEHAIGVQADQEPEAPDRPRKTTESIPRQLAAVKRAEAEAREQVERFRMERFDKRLHQLWETTPWPDLEAAIGAWIWATSEQAARLEEALPGLDRVVEIVARWWTMPRARLRARLLAQFPELAEDRARLAAVRLPLPEEVNSDGDPSPR